MPIPWTLQRYVFKEMGKTFLLAAIGLTGVLGLGGGVRAMIKLGEVTPGQLFRIMGLVLPLAAALTLPVATLFSAAAAYGRLSSDNEFTACRASGINLHILFIPALMLSLVSAIVTFCFINFVVPGMTKNLNDFLNGDIGVLIHHKLNDPRGLRIRDYRLSADGSEVFKDGSERVVLRRVAFVESENENWVRFGTADALHANFVRGEKGLRLVGALSGLTFFDARAGHFVDLAEQSLAAEELAALVPMRIKFLTLGELLHYWRRPSEWVDVKHGIQRAQAAALARELIERVRQDWADDRQVVIRGRGVEYRLRAATAEDLGEHEAMQFNDVSIDESGQRVRFHKAARAIVEFARGDTLEESGLRIEAFDLSGAGSARRAKEVFGPIAALPEETAKVQAMSVDDLLAMEHRLVAGEAPSLGRKIGLAGEIADTARLVSATLHERMAFSLSVLVLVLLAAPLGIVLRGSHMVTAFAVSFVPAIGVIVAIMTGKQLAQNPATQGAGILLIWSGIVVVLAIDWLVATRVLRR